MLQMRVKLSDAALHGLAHRSENVSIASKPSVLQMSLFYLPKFSRPVRQVTTRLWKLVFFLNAFMVLLMCIINKLVRIF